MAVESILGVFMGAIGLGLLHGIEPGHGWPVAGAWALARPRPKRAGVVAATVIGVGHLISSIAVVVLFWFAKDYFDLGEAAWIDWVAGGLLIALAFWQLRSALRDNGDHHHHGHEHGHRPGASAGLAGLAAFAFTLGFVHEEEFQIMAMCAGTAYCLEIMLVYALAVIAALIGLTLLLLYGMKHLSHRLEHAQRQLTLVSAAILALMGIGFLAGVF
ncbi:hypothetical protein PC39_13582 [Salinisphaera sp. PC39]|uniref:hypothetical protein n=1 Tax=Salinisphaera sp. PC39 TaxID=1304156 RepID=UPI00333F4A65